MGPFKGSRFSFGPAEADREEEKERSGEEEGERIRVEIMHGMEK